MRRTAIAVPSAEEMEALGARFARHLGTVRRVHVRGALGAGKTTLVRGLLRGLGHTGAVRSPTFTLVESYVLNGQTVHHFDLYRLQDPEELEFLGIRDYLDKDNVCIVEWPERAGALLPAPDLDVMIEPAEMGRTVQLEAHSRAAETLLGGLR